MKTVLLSLSLCAAISVSAQVNFIATEACYGTQTVFSASSDSSDSVISGWNWDMDNDGQFNGQFDAAGKIAGFNFAQFAGEADTFTVTLKVILNSGDSMFATKNVIVNPLPQVNFQVDNLCEGKQAIYINQSSISWGNITQKKWDFNNDGNYDDIGNDTAIYTCGPAATYITKLECVSDKGCSAFATKTTQIFSQPSANFTLQNACSGGNTTFNNASSVQNDNISISLWSFGDGDSSNITSPSHIYTADGTYNVQLVAITQNFCKDTFTLPVTIAQLVNADFSIQNECLGGTTNFVNNTTTQSGEIISELQWDFGDSTTAISSGGNASHEYAAVGSYSVTLVATTQNTCIGTKTVIVNIAQLVNAAFTAQNACLGASTAFTNSTTTQQGEIISELQWNFGDGISATSTGDTTHDYSDTGTYDVQLVAISQNFCKATFSANVTVNELPIVSLEISGDTINDSTFYKGDEITLSVTGNATSYLWSNNEITSSITVSDSGTYMVTASNANGCSQTLSHKVMVKEVPDTAAAGNDIITPNADGFNDFFIIQDVSGYKQCALNIYNIWNEEVYGVSEYNNDWDGKNKSGKELNAGAYFYILKCDDKPQTIGTVNILR